MQLQCSIYKKKGRVIISQSDRYSRWLEYLGFKIICRFNAMGGVSGLEGAISAKGYFKNDNVSAMERINDNHYEKIKYLKKAERVNPSLSQYRERKAVFCNNQMINILATPKWRREVRRIIRNLKS